LNADNLRAPSFSLLSGERVGNLELQRAESRGRRISAVEVESDSSLSPALKAPASQSREQSWLALKAQQSNPAQSPAQAQLQVLPVQLRVFPA
jgi:hypothetical protein